MKNTIKKVVRKFLQIATVILWLLTLFIVIAWLITDSKRTVWLGLNSESLKLLLGSLGIAFEPLYTVVETFILATLTWVLSNLFESNDSNESIIKNPFIYNPTEHQKAHDRQEMLSLVRRIWITDFLDNSLYKTLLMDLDLKDYPEAVERPWDTAVKMPKQPIRHFYKGTKLIEVFNRMNRSLLILGESGSGKTTLLLELTRDLVNRAELDSSEPIPVVFNLSSWSNMSKPITEWVIKELNEKYFIPERIGHYWLANNELLLLFDGLDEVTANKQKDCVVAINEFKKDHSLSLTVCSRFEDYDKLDTKLHLHSAVVVQPLTQEQIDAYFQSVYVNEYLSLREILQEDSVFKELLRTPLMLNCLAVIEEPNSLENIRRLSSKTEKRHYIFDTYVRRMFARRSSQLEYSPKETIGWLSWLAARTIEQSKTVIRIEEIQPSWLGSRKLENLFVFQGIVSFLLIFYAIFGTIFGPILGLIASELQHQDHFNSLQKHFRQVVPSSLIAALLFGLLAGWQQWVFVETPSSFVFDLPDIGLVSISPSGMSNGPIFGFAFGLICFLLWILIQTLYMLGRTYYPQDIQANQTILPTPRLVWSWTAAGQGLLVGFITAGLIALSNPFFGNWIFYLIYSLTIGLLFGINKVSISQLGVWRQKSRLNRAQFQAWIIIIINIMIGTITGVILEISTVTTGGTLWGIVIGLSTGLINAATRGISDNRSIRRSIWSWHEALKGARTGAIIGAIAGAIGDFELGVIIGEVPNFVVLGFLLGTSFGLNRGFNGTYVTATSGFKWSWKTAFWGLIVGSCGGAILHTVNQLPGKPIFGLIFGIFNSPYTIGQIDSAIIPISALTAAILFGIDNRLGHETLQIRQSIIPIQKLQWSWKASLAGFIIGTIIGFIMSLTVASGGLIIDLSMALRGYINIALRSGIIIGLITAFITGLRGVMGVSNDESITMPNLGIQRSLKYATVIGIVGVALGWIAGGVLSGVLFGLSFWFIYGGDACIKHFILRIFLWKHGYIPWRYAKFLNYCVGRVFLRRVGSGYIFIHRMFQEYFAELYLNRAKQPDLSGL